MDKQQAVIIDKALTQLSDPALETSKAGRRLEKVLVQARASGDVSVDDLRRGAVELVKEVDIRRSFAGDSDEAENNAGLAILFLLILLSILAALADDDSDAQILIEQLIQMLLDLLRGGGSGDGKG